MDIAIEEITCKSALTGSGGHYRLNPYGGCEHACVYCYATYLTRWRGQSGPWGTWVQVKTNVARVLEKELRRKRGIEVFLSTACDVYQPVEKQYRLTRQCLSVLALAAQQDEGPHVFVVTKSDLILRDLDVLQVFPEGKLKVAFSVTTHRDEVAAIVEPHAPSPSRRLAALRTLTAAGIHAGLLVSPVLPYVTERDLPELLDEAEQAGCQFIGFDMLHYLDRHVGAKLREAYRHLGQEAQERLEQARDSTTYEPEVRQLIARLMKGRRFGDQTWRS
ncbi:MAG: radical SAM protein [Armatimonadia bacterium]